MEKNSKLEFGEFLDTVKKTVKEVFGEGYNVEINHVIKNNSIELDGLIILKDRERITPNIYMNCYYEKYLAGGTIPDITKEIIQIYRDKKKEGDQNFLKIRFELEEMKNCIIYRLVNYDRNRKLLMEVPHIPFLDLAVTFHCLVKNNDKGIGTIRITNKHIKNWGITTEDLKEIARVNTPLMFPPVIRSMNEVIQEIFHSGSSYDAFFSSDKQKMIPSDKVPEECKNLSEENFFPEKPECPDYKRISTMYVISNETGINGASCLLYPQVIKKLAKELNADLYILPSSIHEIIVVKANIAMNKKSFREMVFDVNHTQVSDEDVLSDNVYYYSRERDAITV